MKSLSLFSGIGGLDLAFEWAGGQVAAMCEIDKYCQKVLRKHWPDVPLFGDIKELKADSVGTVDIIYGGFPCQPFSVAGKQKGQNDDRYLWPEFSRLVEELRPRWVVGENVPGILRLAADDVCADLERQGYEVGIWDFEAAAVGARHRRERIFFVAHAGRSLQQGDVKRGYIQEETGKGNALAPERPSKILAAYTDCERCEEQQQSVKTEEAYKAVGCDSGRQPKSGMDRGFNGFPDVLDGSISPTTNGISNRTNRLKALGNAVVPQQAYPIFKAIMEADK